MLLIAAMFATIQAVPAGPPPEWLRTQALRLAETEMNDARSARWLWTPHNGQEGGYCGWVNGKNAFGAYTGYQPFLVLYRERTATSVSVGRQPLVNAVCPVLGYDITQPPALPPS